MQCPICGYEGIDEEACFCPHCRYQFLEPEPDLIFESPVPSQASRKRPVSPGAGDRFTKYELCQLQVQLLMPSLLLMLAFAAVFYSALGQVPGLAVRIGSAEVPCAGFLGLIAGAGIGWIFYRIVLFRIQ